MDDSIKSNLIVNVDTNSDFQCKSTHDNGDDDPIQHHLSNGVTNESNIVLDNHVEEKI